MDAGARFDPAALRLVAVTDSLRDGVAGLTSRARAAVDGGATMIQLRLPDESARTMVQVARALLDAVPDVPLVVNARADVALAAGAQGVHLGVDDLSAAALRRVLPPGMIIGASAGGDADVERARDADYVGIGPVYASASGTDAGASIGIVRFAELAAQCGRPAIAIGGVSMRNAGEAMRAGASGVAVISALFGASDPRDAGRSLRAALDASGS